jgi:hypothetical protein
MSFINDIRRHNTERFAAQNPAVRPHGGLPIPQRDLSYTQIVHVKNSSASDFAQYQPIWVMYPDRGFTTEPDPLNAGLPDFPGYALDDSGVYEPCLGIAQESIAVGDSGRVCVRGFSRALLYKTGDSFDYLNYVAIQKINDRWIMRRSLLGPARFMQLLDLEVYQDGTYNDSLLALIELNPPPNIRLGYNPALSTISARSIIWAGDGAFRKTDEEIIDAGGYTPWTEHQLAATCGYDIPAGGAGWAYEFTESLPVAVACGTNNYPSGTTVSWGPIGGQFLAYQNLPGLRPHRREWSPSGSTNHYWWFYKDLTLAFWVKAASDFTGGVGHAYGVDSSHTNAYDGISLPLVYSSVYPAGESIYSSFSKCLNIKAGQLFKVRLSAGLGGFIAGAEYLDEPIGTIRIIPQTSSIPQGWSEVNYSVPTLLALGGSGTLTYGTGMNSITYTQFRLIQRTS